MRARGKNQRALLSLLASMEEEYGEGLPIEFSDHLSRVLCEITTDHGKNFIAPRAAYRTAERLAEMGLVKIYDREGEGFQVRITEAGKLELENEK